MIEMDYIEKEILLEINKNISTLENLIIKSDSLDKLDLQELKLYKENLYKSYNSIELILRYTSVIIHDKIVNNNDLDLVDKIMELEC